jgi:hypothetical protein
VTIRFHQRNEPVGKPRGYARTYQVEDGERVRWSCDVTNDLWPAVRFMSPDASEPDFSIVPTRRVMALSYRVVTGEDGDVLGLISRSMGASRWKLENDVGNEVARIVNPTAWPKALLEQAFDQTGRRFAFMHDDDVLAFVLRRPRAAGDRPGNRFKRWVRHHLRQSDWTLEPESDIVHLPDLRLLISATLLLLELDINVQG